MIQRVLPLVLLLLVASQVVAAAPDYVELRSRMVNEEIVAAGIKDRRVIDAMRVTPRHEFVGAKDRPNAYYDMALPIGDSQTISPPFVVAYMTEQLAPKAGDKVLEIGTGSGYQAAVLSSLAKDVYSIEIVKPLGERAARTLKRLKYTNVHTKIGDGYQGWPEHAPFDKIIVTCSPEKVPAALVEQLREGGSMIVPVGERYQQTLYLFQKKGGELEKMALLPTLFVPMTGAAETGREVLPDPANPVIANGGFETVVTSVGEVESNLVGANKPAATKTGAKTTAKKGEKPEPAKPGAKPDPLEEKPAGWHYQRQLQLVTGEGAPEGKNYVLFSNSEPGRFSRAMQGLAVDGRKVGELEISLEVRGKDLRQGPTADDVPVLGIMFYDEKRALLPGGAWAVGPWRDTFDWKKQTEKVKVPIHAREAIVRIGLHGATGELSLDDIKMTAIKRK